MIFFYCLSLLQSSFFNFLSSVFFFALLAAALLPAQDSARGVGPHDVAGPAVLRGVALPPRQKEAAVVAGRVASSFSLMIVFCTSQPAAPFPQRVGGRPLVLALPAQAASFLSHVLGRCFLLRTHLMEVMLGTVDGGVSSLLMLRRLFSFSTCCC